MPTKRQTFNFPPKIACSLTTPPKLWSDNLTEYEFVRVEWMRFDYLFLDAVDCVMHVQTFMNLDF